MTEIKIKKILKLSSQDSVFKAENLLKGCAHGEEDTKWIGAKDGETKQFIIIELEKPTEIHQINVENESSAFVEIRVGDAKAEDEEEDFEVVLSAVSLMTPSESKSRLNTNRLKIFTSEKDLDKDIARKKSQRVHVICTQPFNSNIQFGLSSIKFYDQVLATPDLPQINAGSFSLKKEFSSSASGSQGPKQSSEINAGSLFKRAKERKEEEKEDQEPSTSKTSTSKPEYFLDFKSKASISSGGGSEDEKENKRAPQNGNAKVKEQKPEKKPEPVKTGPVLKGVVFALSGFQNPLRSELRDKALKLGAKYRPDWTDECTHLICAFANTPKAAQVRQTGGKIVTTDWLFSCEKAKKLLDEEDFELAKPHSDSDDDEDTSKPRKAARAATKKISTLKKKTEFDDSFEEEEAENSDDRDFIVDSSEIEMDEDASDESDEVEESGDSDDSERATSKKRDKKKARSQKPTKKPKSEESNSKKKAKKADSSDSDSDQSASKSKSRAKDKKDENLADWELPTFFEDKQFYVYGNFDEKELRNIKRQLVAFGGNLNNYMSDDIDYVITDKDWSDDFRKAKEENNKLVIVNQDWLEACTRRKKLVAHKPYEVKDD